MAGNIYADFQIVSEKFALPLHQNDLQPGSLDLRPAKGASIYEIAGIPNLGASFSPQEFLRHYTRNIVGKFSHRNRVSTILTPQNTYMFRLEQSFNLPKNTQAVFDTKSSLGRIDCDIYVVGKGSASFDVLPSGYSGNVYAIVMPESFPIGPTAFTPLVQARFVEGERQYLHKRELEILHALEPLVGPQSSPSFTDTGLVLHLDLAGRPSNLVGVKGGKPIFLNKKRSLDPHIYFREKPRDSRGNLFLEPGEFLLARTRERVRIPLLCCAEMSAFSREHGDVRWHKAGFIDTGFGLGREQRLPGSTIVCEIHNLSTRPRILSHGEEIGVLRFHLLKGSPKRLYGDGSHYQGQQEVTLAKYFLPWE